MNMDFVIENGILKAISPGTTEIKAVSEDGNKEAICKVTVTAPELKSISFKNESQLENTLYFTWFMDNKVQIYSSPEIEILNIEVEQAIMQYSIEDIDRTNPDLEW